MGVLSLIFRKKREREYQSAHLAPTLFQVTLHQNMGGLFCRSSPPILTLKMTQNHPGSLSNEIKYIESNYEQHKTNINCAILF